MRMYQDERRFDFHGLGLALKQAREECLWLIKKQIIQTQIKTAIHYSLCKKSANRKFSI